MVVGGRRIVLTPQKHNTGYFLFRKVKPGTELWTDEAGKEFCFRFSSSELFKNPLFYLTKSLNLGTTCN
jgi:hypothetical protein